MHPERSTCVYEFSDQRCLWQLFLWTLKGSVCFPLVPDTDSSLQCLRLSRLQPSTAGLIHHHGCRAGTHGDQKPRHDFAWATSLVAARGSARKLSTNNQKTLRAPGVPGERSRKKTQMPWAASDFPGPIKRHQREPNRKDIAKPFPTSLSCGKGRWLWSCRVFQV